MNTLTSPSRLVLLAAALTASTAVHAASPATCRPLQSEASYPGSYRLSDGRDLDISTRQGRLYARIDGGRPLAIHERVPGRFSDAREQLVIVFCERNKLGGHDLVADLATPAGKAATLAAAPSTREEALQAH